jgi:tRNA threonylcarbamoyladenosine biosynthesis protein TsaE
MVKPGQYVSPSPVRTKKEGAALAKEILKYPKRKAIVMGLEGDLGGGKTTFLQGFARGLGIKQKILSPTFVILKRFSIKSSRFNNFYHLDCYRIQKPKEILSLGFKKIISDPKNIVAVEWADRIKKILPKGTLVLKFIFIDRSKRKIILEYK